MPNILTQDEFYIKASRLQDTSIDLSKSLFVNTRTKVLVGCNVCGTEWDILPKALFNKSIKCPTCDRRDRVTSSYIDGTMTLYFIKIRTDMIGEPEHIYKVGITKYNVLHRFSPSDLRRIEILREVEFKEGKECYEMEQYIHSIMRDYKYYGKFKLDSNGNTELLTKNPIEFLYERGFNGDN